MREPEGIDVQEFEWDEWNIAHLSQHGVTPDKADEIRTVAPRFFHNLPDRAGTHVVIGPDSQQNFYYIVLRPMGRPGEWRPVIGWRMNQRKASRLYGAGWGDK